MFFCFWKVCQESRTPLPSEAQTGKVEFCRCYMLHYKQMPMRKVFYWNMMWSQTWKFFSYVQMESCPIPLTHIRSAVVGLNVMKSTTLPIFPSIILVLPLLGSRSHNTYNHKSVVAQTLQQERFSRYGLGRKCCTSWIPTTTTRRSMRQKEGRSMRKQCTTHQAKIRFTRSSNKTPRYSWESQNQNFQFRHICKIAKTPKVWEETREELLKKQKKKGQSMHETKLRMHIYLSSNREFS